MSRTHRHPPGHAASGSRTTSSTATTGTTRSTCGPRRGWTRHATSDTLEGAGAIVRDYAPDAAKLIGLLAAYVYAAPISRVVEIDRAVGVPRTLAEIGLPRVAEPALGAKRLLAIAPIEPTRDVLLELLERAHEGVLSA